MKRTLSALLVVVILVLFVSDLFFLNRYSQHPDRFSSVHEVSVWHGYLLHEYGYYFAVVSLFFSGTLLVVWLEKLVKPASPGRVLHLTSMYALFLMLKGVLVLTAMVGVLQMAAGVAVDVLDFAILISFPVPMLLILLCSVVGFPLLLMLLSRLYGRRFIQC